MSAAPGGIKLHEEVTHLLGACVHFAIGLAAELYHSTWHVVVPMACLLLGTFSCVFGLCTGFGLLSDMLAVMEWPVAVLYTCVAKLYSLQLHYLGVTWQLMRGSSRLRRKRRQPQPQSQDTMTPASPGGMVAALWGNQQSKVRFTLA